MKKNYRSLFLSLLLGVFCFGSLIAQSQAPSSSTEIAARITALQAAEKTNITDNQIELSDELRRIDDELAHRRTDLANYDAANKELDQDKASAVKLFQDIDALDCAKVGGTVPEAANLGEIVNSILKVVPGSTETNPWAAISLGSDQKLAAKDQCQKLKEAIGDATKRQTLLAFIDNKRKENEAGRTQLNLLIEALQKRRGALLQHVSAATAQTKVGDDLWKIILVIGLLSVGTIIAIRLFSPDIQVEWVSSGQVIQFVTVMILLTVIMALGLAGILKENTLGTLLGGIGGYVLSQGVGKAAAAAVQRSIIGGGAAQAAALATPPVITALSAAAGTSTGGTPVKITGTGFAAGATVTFEGATATITNQTNTTIDVTTPGHAVGPVDVVVTNPDKQSAKAPTQFTYQ
jgi:Skp family chaperone for outer membrane proteins